MKNGLGEAKGESIAAFAFTIKPIWGCIISSQNVFTILH
jgi:hypothetical protein